MESFGNKDASKPQSANANTKSIIRTTRNTVDSSVERTKPDSNINSRSVQNKPIDATAKSNEGISTKHSPDVQATLDVMNKNHADTVRRIKNDRVMDSEMKSKRTLAEGMRHSTAKRELIQGDRLVSVDGGLTPKELSKKIEYLKSNHKDKKVTTPNGDGVVTGRGAFGKVGVKISDGSVKYYSPKDVVSKVDIDGVIAKQIKESSKLTEVSKTVESELSDPTNKIQAEPVKAETLQVERVKTESAKTDLPSRTPPNEPQNTGESKTKTNTSQFRTNTVERANEISKGSKESMPKDLFDYEIESSVEWQSKAVQNVASDRASVIDNIKNAKAMEGGVMPHESAIIAKQLEEEALKTGNVTKLLSWLQTVAEKTRKPLEH